MWRFRTLPRHRERVLVGVFGQAVRRASVGAMSEVEEFAVEARGAVGLALKCLVDADNRPERLLVQVDVVLRARGSLGVRALAHLQRLNAVAEQFPQVFLGSPEKGRQRSRGRRRRVRRDDAEDLRCQADRGEARHADRSAGPAYADEFVRDLVVVGSEDRPEGRRDDIELVLAERQRLRVGLNPLDGDPAGLRFVASGFGSTSNRTLRVGRGVEAADRALRLVVLQTTH
jgi:hypothetical protein